MFREDNGKLSFSRVSSFILIVAYIIWASYIVVKEGRIPPIPPELVALISIAYGINKVGPNIRVRLGGER